MKKFNKMMNCLSKFLLKYRWKLLSAYILYVFFILTGDGLLSNLYGHLPSYTIFEDFFDAIIIPIMSYFVIILYTKKDKKNAIDR